tara:strand:+ start:99 stop:710 length:612 start_codon:yes stop_codon:yes gene_type:complete
MEEGVHACFQTPMAYYYNTDIIDDLKSYIYSLEGKGIESNIAPHIKHNLVESKFNLFAHESDIIKKTSKWIGDSVKETVNHIQMEKYGYNLRFNDSWYHITKINGMHEPHLHPSCSWCGVFYVQSGDEGSGETVFQTPVRSTYLDRGNLYLNNISSVRVKPKDGMLVLFPSYLIHYQAPYKGTQDRIVIAFNCSVTDIIKEGN